MTGKKFRRQVYLTVTALLVVTLVSLAVGVFYEQYADASRAAVPMYIALAAAWLTFCLQRRIAYTNALRTLWEKVVDTIQGVFQYTFLKEPQEKDLAPVLRSLSCRIDEVRGVFRNVGESYEEPSIETKEFVDGVKAAVSDKAVTIDVLKKLKTPSRSAHIGVYPFETLKQIRAVVEKLGCGPSVTEDKSKDARRIITALWQILRAELLKELDRDYPEFPDTPYRR